MQCAQLQHRTSIIQKTDEMLMKAMKDTVQCIKIINLLSLAMIENDRQIKDATTNF